MKATPKACAAMKSRGEFFDVLGIKPLLGRAFRRADEEAGGGPGGFKVILSHNFWQQHFRRDRRSSASIARTRRRPYTVIGVMPAGFQFPIQTEPIESTSRSRRTRRLRRNQAGHGTARQSQPPAIARLKPGVPIAQAQAELRTHRGRARETISRHTTPISAPALQPLREELVGDVRAALYVLFGAVVCVLLIANANVANLLLARASVRAEGDRPARGARRESRTHRPPIAHRKRAPRRARRAAADCSSRVGNRSPSRPSRKTFRASATFNSMASSLPSLSWSRSPPALSSGSARPGRPRASICNTALKTAPAARAAAQGSIGCATRSSWRKSRSRSSSSSAPAAHSKFRPARPGPYRLAPGASSHRAHRLARVRLSEDRKTSSRSSDQLLPRFARAPGVRTVSTIVPLPLSGSNMVTSFDIEEHPCRRASRTSARCGSRAGLFRNDGHPAPAGPRSSSETRPASNRNRS